MEKKFPFTVANTEEKKIERLYYQQCDSYAVCKIPPKKPM